MSSKEATRQGRSLRTRLLIIFAVLLLILSAAGYLAGDYFFRYALTRNSGSEKRQVQTTEKAKEAEDQRSLLVQEAKAQAEEAWKAYAEREQRRELKTSDGLLLRAFSLEPEQRKEDSWVVLVHGYKTKHEAMKAYALHYLQQGYRVLMPDNRAHGQSEGQILGMGILDAQDIQAWLEQLRQEEAGAQFILHGVSMGAATVMNVAAANPEGVKAVIEDCGYSSVHAIFSSELKKRYGLPAFPILNFAELVGRLKGGYAFDLLRPVDSVAKTRLPLLLIHGEADDFVPYAMLDELYQAAAGHKQRLSIAGAGHAQSVYLQPDAYWQAVDQFLANWR